MYKEKIAWRTWLLAAASSGACHHVWTWERDFSPSGVFSSFLIERWSPFLCNMQSTSFPLFKKVKIQKFNLRGFLLPRSHSRQGTGPQWGWTLCVPVPNAEHWTGLTIHQSWPGHHPQHALPHNLKELECPLCHCSLFLSMSVTLNSGHLGVHTGSEGWRVPCTHPALFVLDSGCVFFLLCFLTPFLHSFKNSFKWPLHIHSLNMYWMLLFVRQVC